jgi:small subunit ribosomal protein S1
VIVSHSRLFEDVKNPGKTGSETETDSTAKSIKKVKDNLEKSTLGDMGVLSALRSELASEEKEAKAKGDNPDNN